jgi:hypothetical protein
MVTGVGEVVATVKGVLQVWVFTVAVTEPVPAVVAVSVDWAT